MVLIPDYSAVAVSAVSGQVLWRKVMPESVMYIQCGLGNSTQPSNVCLLIGKTILTAVISTSGREGPVPKRISEQTLQLSNKLFLYFYILHIVLAALLNVILKIKEVPSQPKVKCL